MTATLTTLDVVVDPLGVGGHTVCNLQQQQATLATNDQMSGECHSVHSVWRPPRRVLLLALPLAKGFCARLENFFLQAISSYLHQTLSAFACCVFKFMSNVFFLFVVVVVAAAAAGGNVAYAQFSIWAVNHATNA